VYLGISGFSPSNVTVPFPALVLASNSGIVRVLLSVCQDGSVVSVIWSNVHCIGEGGVIVITCMGYLEEHDIIQVQVTNSPG
jgi:hypothetical protein